MRRILSILLAIILLVLFCSSCTPNVPGNSNNSSSETPPSNSASEAASPSSDPVSSDIPYELPSSLPPLSAEMQQKAKDAQIHLKSSGEPFEVFQGIQWGMTTEEVFSALGITEQQVQHGSEYEALAPDADDNPPLPDSQNQTFFLWDAAEIDGTPAALIIFYMMAEDLLLKPEDYGEPGTQRLYLITVFYQNQHQNMLDRVMYPLSEHYKKRDGQIKITSYSPFTIECTSSEYPYWYKDHLQSVLKDEAVEKQLRQVVDRRADGTPSVWAQDHDEWNTAWNERKKNTFLTEVYATDSDQWYCNRISHPKGPFIAVSYEGSHALQLKMVERFVASQKNQ